MARILHLEADPGVREVISSALMRIGHTVTGFSSVSDAENSDTQFDLFICDATVEDHFDGLLFALDRKSEGKKVLILAHSHKFSRVPFLSKSSVHDPVVICAKVRSLLRS